MYKNLSYLADSTSSGVSLTSCTISVSDNQQGLQRSAGSSTTVPVSCQVNIDRATCVSVDTNYMCFYVTNSSTSSFTESNDVNNVYCLATSGIKTCPAGSAVSCVVLVSKSILEVQSKALTSTCTCTYSFCNFDPSVAE